MEEVLLARDAESGLVAVFALHSTLAGPAIGGVRLHVYPTEEAALEDAARIARLATYRAALARIPFGGACAVISAPAQDFDRQALMTAFGRALQTFEGRVIASEDLGCDTGDMDIIRSVTPFACGGSRARVGDSSYYTALGVLRAIEACVRHRFGTDSLRGLRVGVYGIGSVGFQVCEMLHLAQARVYAADLSPLRVRQVADNLNAEFLPPEALLTMELDVLVPCAVGHLFTDESIPGLRCAIIAGSSNSQLVNPVRHARMLMERDILYAPDFAVNAGSLYANACEISGYDAPRAVILANGIYDTVTLLLEQSQTRRLSTVEVAMERVHDRLRRARAARIMAFV